MDYIETDYKKYIDLNLNETLETMIKSPKFHSGNLLITHTDLDGMGCVIADYLLTADERSVIFSGASLVEENLLSFIDEFGFPKDLLITDLSFKDKKFFETLYRFYNKYEVEGLTICVVDHHKTALWMDEYPCCHISDEEGVSATKALYDLYVAYSFEDEYALLDSLVKKISRYDTWVWKTSDEYVKDEWENILFQLYGKEAYIEKRIKDPIGYDPIEILFIESFNKIRRNKIEKAYDSLTVFIKDGHQFQLYIGEIDISALSEYNKVTSDTGSTDIVAVLYLGKDKRTLSFRTANDAIDVSEIAKHFAEEGKGGGHAKAAGCTISKELALEMIRAFYEV